MGVTPYLYYEDVEAALTFLANAFSFRTFGEQVRDGQGRLTHAAAQLGENVVMMGCPGPAYRSPRRLGQATFSLYVNIDDVDAHFTQAKAAGAKIIEDPTDTPYGDRRYGVTDLEGHEWYFATPSSAGGTEQR